MPPGFALSTGAFHAFVDEAGVRDEIESALARISPGDMASVNAASGAIGELLGSASVPGSVREEVERHYGELAADPEPPVAVRSSALGEDSAEATFAGQQETFLWVRGVDGVCNAMRDCWISLYSPEALSYRARLGGGEADAMGVTIQLMADARISGVMFTCNPVSGDPSMVAISTPAGALGWRWWAAR